MKFRGVAIRLEEPLNLLPGNQDFPHHLAARQLAALQQPADGFVNADEPTALDGKSPYCGTLPVKKGFLPSCFKVRQPPYLMRHA